MVLSASMSSADPSSAMRGLSRFRRRLGTEMCEVLPGLFLGSLRDATDDEQIKRNRIKCILSVHELTAEHPAHSACRVLRLPLSDCPSVNIAAHFSQTNDFIHEARCREEAVLVHCLAGVSRSACVVVAYLLTVTDLSYFSALSLVASRRPVVNPNFGFRMQLAKFAEKGVRKERDRLRDSCGRSRFDAQFDLDKETIAAGCRARGRTAASAAMLDSALSSSVSSGYSSSSPRSRPAGRSLFQHHLRFRRSYTLGTPHALVMPVGGAAPQPSHARSSHPFSFADMLGRMNFIDD